MYFPRLFPALALAAGLSATPAFADMCDYKPSRLAGAMTSAATAGVGGGAAVAGAGLKAAGYYTLVHSTSGLAMLGSTAAGGSAAGTAGILAGTAGFGATVASILMAPITITVGALTVVAVGGYEGLCYFQVDRVEDPFKVLGIVQSIAENDPNVSLNETDEGLAMRIDLEEGAGNYLVRNLYIADGQLMHRDWFLNTDLGPVAFVAPEEEVGAETQE